AGRRRSGSRGASVLRRRGGHRGLVCDRQPPAGSLLRDGDAGRFWRRRAALEFSRLVCSCRASTQGRGCRARGRAAAVPANRKRGRRSGARSGAKSTVRTTIRNLSILALALATIAPATTARQAETALAGTVTGSVTIGG